MNEDRIEVPDLAFDLRYLRYAVAAAAHGSFRQTALALDTSQSTVTRRIQLLEHRLGFALFVRDRRGVRLTHAGDNFLKEAMPGIDQLRRAIHVASSKDELHNGVLRIGLLASLAAGSLHCVLKEVRKRQPAVRITLHEGTAERNLHRLAKGDLDITFVTGLPRLPRHKAEIMWQEPIFVVLPSSHPLALNAELVWDDIRSELFIVSSFGPGPDVHDLLVRKIGDVGFRPRIEVHHVGRESLINLVAMGYGVTLTSASALGLAIEGVVFRPIAHGTEQVPWSAVWSETNENPALSMVLEIARAIAAEQWKTEPDAPLRIRDPSR